MSDAMHTLLPATPLLDLHHPDIEALVACRGWRALRPYDRIGAVYDFVRNEIAFGYNEGDELPASRVLADGIGQCNTKSTLLMALPLPRLHHSQAVAEVVVEVKDVDYELVAKATVIQLHLRDHGRPADVSKATAKVTLLTGAEKQEVKLKSAGDKLEATGSFKVGPGTKAVAVVTAAGKPATARFTLK